MKRFVAVVMLAGGLLVAGGAQAVALGNSNFDCAAGNNGTPATITGLNMRLPQNLLDALKLKARAQGIPYTRYVRLLLEKDVARGDLPPSK